MKEVILTPEGYEKLKEEIEYLSTEKRREVAERIRIAREFGDIAENAEYDDAKNEQAMLEHRIATLEERLCARARDREEGRSPRTSSRSARVVRLRTSTRRRRSSTTSSARPRRTRPRSKLSNESPVGKAIIGRKKGETVEVSAPRGSLKFKIMDIKAA